MNLTFPAVQVRIYRGGMLRFHFHSFPGADLQTGQFHKWKPVAAPAFFLIAGLAALSGAERIRLKCPLCAAWAASVPFGRLR